MLSSTSIEIPQDILHAARMTLAELRLELAITLDLDRLRQVAGFYISGSFYKRILKDAAEE